MVAGAAAVAAGAVSSSVGAGAAGSATSREGSGAVEGWWQREWSQLRGCLQGLWLGWTSGRRL